MSKSIAVDLRQVTKKFGSFTAVNNISLAIEEGEFFSLLGPSGCGKTTTLRMIAGFELPSAGEIYLQGDPVGQLPPFKRDVNTVFQNYALFPHLTVAENVAFGLQMKKVPQSEIDTRVRQALEMVRLPDVAERKPRQLSGGMKQRVALARALVNRPKVLLLDEPLGALDLKLRKAMQFELKQIQQEVGITFIYVTHDQEEALTMSDRIAVMNKGLVQQVGAPRDIYEHPQNRFVADFIGETNFVEGKVATTAGDITSIAVGAQTLQGTADGRALQAGQTVFLAIRPEKINLYPQGEMPLQKMDYVDKNALIQLFNGRELPETIDVGQYLSAETDQAIVHGTIQDAIYIGTDTRYRVSLEAGVDVFVRVQNFGDRYDIPLTIGDPVYVHWAPENAQLLTE
ncbi:MAG: ABC transporter ATP-binding protein [Anaerolineales bacterium]|nr:ABC transporter ATP-binding protein [Anaerolineales bacterium]